MSLFLRKSEYLNQNYIVKNVLYFLKIKMTKPEMIEAIRKACIKANPEIVELKFGCKVKLPGEVIAIFVRDNNSFVTDDKRRFVDHLGIKPSKFDIKEIIGREIGLADVLMAINKKNGHIGNVYCRDDGVFGILEQDDEYHNFRLSEKWDLTKPLTLQSEETIRFIFSLLING